MVAWLRMSFKEQQTILAGELAQLQGLIRQAQERSRQLVEHAEAVADQTETFADDTVLARVLSTAKRARHDLGTLVRVVGDAREGVGEHEP